jgi:hypothetical protein
MTIGVAWIRKGLDGDELWICSDSRLTGDGNIWDDCPKLIPLPRRDAVAGFSGSTAQAYPLLLQLANAIGYYRAAADGTLEFSRLAGHLERVANAMMNRIIPDPAVTGTPLTNPEFATRDDTLIIGGYSRAQGKLVLRSLRYLPDRHRWYFYHVRPSRSFGRTRVIVVFGDNRSKSRFRYLLELLLEQRGVLHTEPLSFEPLEVLANMLRMPPSTESQLPMDHRPTSIGGAPQIFRVLPGAQSCPMAVLWTVNGRTAVYLQGRETFGYENLDVPLIVFDNPFPSFYGPGKWPESVIRAQGDLGKDDEADTKN